VNGTGKSGQVELSKVERGVVGLVAEVWPLTVNAFEVGHVLVESGRPTEPNRLRVEERKCQMMLESCWIRKLSKEQKRRRRIRKNGCV
jgi:hypothetical protein